MSQSYPKVTMALLQELKELSEKATQVVAWYPHTEDDTVRGPFGRWFHCSGGDNGMGDPIKYPVPVAMHEDDVKYCALAMNLVPALIGYIEELKAQLEKRK